MSLIELSSVKKTFKTKNGVVEALRGIDFSVEEGSFTLILGRSGSGKSTLLNIVGFMDDLTSGSYRFDGEDVSTLSSEEKAAYRAEKIGFIFQRFNLINTMSAFENVELPLGYAGIPKEERQERVRTMLKRVGIAERASHRPADMSGGEQQRAAIARALIKDPRLILADEPTGSLDEDNAVLIMKLLKDINASGTTVIMVTHDKDLVRYAGSSVHMKNGVITDTLPNEIE